MWGVTLVAYIVDFRWNPTGDIFVVMIYDFDVSGIAFIAKVPENCQLGAETLAPPAIPE